MLRKQSSINTLHFLIRLARARGAVKRIPNVQTQFEATPVVQGPALPHTG